MNCIRYATFRHDNLYIYSQPCPYDRSFIHFPKFPEKSILSQPNQIARPKNVHSYTELRSASFSESNDLSDLLNTNRVSISESMLRTTANIYAFQMH